MRIPTGPIVFLLLASACSPSEQAPEVNRLEINLSGWSSLEVDVNDRGGGRYHLNDPPLRDRRGSFSISPQQYQALLKRLQPFQRQSEPLTDASVRKFLEATCPRGVPNLTDQGGFWVHWIGSDYNQHYVADFGCDHERQRARNEELVAILRSLPVQLPR